MSVDVINQPKLTKHQREYPRRKERYRQRYADLIKRLGGKCEKCGSVEDLSVDHRTRQEWGTRHREKSSWHRIVIYEREEKEGKLRVLCGSCNSKFWERDHAVNVEEVADIPF